MRWPLWDGVGAPPVGAGEVARGVGEDDVGDHAVRPLRGQQGVEFGEGPVHVEVGKADGDERRVPAPHVRVELGGGGDEGARVVVAQDRRGTGGESRGWQFRRAQVGRVDGSRVNGSGHGHSHDRWDSGPTTSGVSG